MIQVPDRFATLVQSIGDPAAAVGLKPHPQACEAKAAVLMLLSDRDNPDLVFTERSTGLRNHAGQISFPGGRRDAGDLDSAHTALREANEEIGLAPQAVRVLGQLPPARVPIGSYQVAPVVGLWSGSEPISAHSPAEVASVQRWTISELAEPSHRVTFVHPRGTTGPAWVFGEMFLWGFTAHLVDRLLTLGGWNQSWDTSRRVMVPRRFSSDRQPS